MIIIYIGLLFAILFFALLIYRDIMCPAVIQTIPWLISLSILSLTNYSYNENSFSFLYIILGSIIFQFGFAIGINKLNIGNRYSTNINILEPRFFSFKILLILEVLFIVVSYVMLYIYISNNFVVSVFTTIKLGYAQNQSLLPGTFDYIRNIITAVTICMMILYYYIEDEKKKRYIKYLVVQALIGILNILPAASRNSMLLLAFSVLVVVIVLNNINNRLAIKYLTIFSTIFLCFFLFFTLNKYYYLFNNQSKTTVLIDQIALYSSGSLLAFENYFYNKGVLLYGSNTFRFFFALFDSIFRTSYSNEIVQDFVRINGTNSSNVYTFYHYYAKDFGLVYALIIQGFVGIFHGISYKRLKNKTPLNVYFFSIMMYPLVMQFFQDQYASITSNWIQLIVMAVIFFKTNLFLLNSNSSRVTD